MNKFIFVLLIGQLAISSKGLAQENRHAEITYIGNEGFMIVNNDKKMLIDALYNNAAGGNGIVNIDESLNNRMMNNQEPFANSNIYFVTHSHADHYNKAMVSNYLQNNTLSMLVADSTVIDPLKATFGNSLFSATPARYHSVDTTLNGIPFSVYNLKHNSAVKIYNVGYWVNVDGLRIFHTGDNILEDTTEYLNTNLFTKQVDVAFLNYNGFLSSTANSDFIVKHMNPQSIVLMHIPDNQLSSVKQKVSKLDKSYPPIFVFNASMEKITVTDIAVISNHQPVKLCEMADTICYTNTPVTIHIPSLFEDPDLNDSLTYAVTGLPDGISFDSKNMILTGSTEKTDISTIKITATDKSLCSNSLTFNLTLSKPSSFFEKRLPDPCVYPVPSANYLWLDQPVSPGLKIQIVDLQGKIFKDEFVKTNPIDISGLSKGTYILHLTGSGKITDQRIVKE